MGLNEDVVQQHARIEAAKYGCILLRNNSGVLEDKNGRPVRYGLANESSKQNESFKSSDLIGITPIVITPDMVGRTIGVFTAIEVKKEGWAFKIGNKREVAQLAFINWVKKLGGIASFCSSGKDMDLIIKEFYAKF